MTWHAEWGPSVLAKGAPSTKNAMDAVEPVVDPGVAPPVVKTFNENFADTDDIYFQIIALGEATYLWMGHEEARQDNLALGVPTSSGSSLSTSGVDGLSAKHSVYVPDVA